MKIKMPLFAPLDDKGGAVLEEVKPLGGKEPKADDDTALINTLIGDKDIIDLDEQEEKEEEEEKEEPELEADDDELLVPEVENSRAVDLTKIKEKYPDFAKTSDFKELRNAYHREGEYTKLFPTVEDAKEAAENNETFVRLNDDLVNKGDPTSVLSSLKTNSPESFKKVVTSFLDTVNTLDKDAYVEVISPVVRRLAKQIFSEGQRYLKRNADSDDGKALVATANNILHYAFPDEDIDPSKDETPRTDPKLKEKEEELTKREQGILQEKYNAAYGVAERSVEHNLDKLIIQGLDPDGKFNDFTRDSLLEKIKNEVKGQINKDDLHVRKMTSLWKRAETEGFNRDSLSRIVSAYLERARPIIPTARNKFRSIALKGKTTDKSESEEKDLKLVNRGRSGRVSGNDGKVNIRAADPKKIDYKNVSDDDIFNGKVKLKA